jgi:signal transduction histidine kinase
VGGVRVRSALSAAFVVAAAVGLAGVGLVYTARQTLTGSVEDSALERSGQVTEAIQSGDPDILRRTLRPAPGDQTVVQILDSTGQVIDASPGLYDRPPITTLRPGLGATQWQQRLVPPDGEDEVRIAATTVATAQGDRIVVVAQSMRPVNESVEVLTQSTAIGMPLLALIVGLATFHFVGRSLQPVEAIRRRVAGITAKDLRARVPVPAAWDEVAALAETMNRMLDRLQSAADAQRRFIADASHELRSPLATLQVGLDVMTPATPQVARLRGETDRLARLVSDLLLLARADEHGLLPRADEVDLDDLAYTHRERLAAQHPQLKVDAHITPVRVRGDLHQLDRSVANLADNAAQHARTHIRLVVRAEGPTAHLTVEDDGPGIPAADRERVFGRFVRLDDSRTRDDGGSGLGLAIVREIASGHQGTVAVETSALGGARLHMTLPICPPPADPAIAPVLASAAVAVGETDGASLKTAKPEPQAPLRKPQTVQPMLKTATPQLQAPQPKPETAQPGPAAVRAEEAECAS